MNRRLAAFVALALVLAIVFVRLGFWQLDRLAQRRARNAVLAGRMAEPMVSVERLGSDAAYRRARLRGVADLQNEIVFTGRSRNGSPGVYLVTPVRRAGTDTAMLVVRGWVYSPDASSVDASRWREERSEYSGYLLDLPQRSNVIETRAKEHKLRALSQDGAAALLRSPVAPYYLVSQDSAPASAPARLPSLAFDEGPHLSYAIQWFAFAAIAILGAGTVVVRARRERAAAGSTGA